MKKSELRKIIRQVVKEQFTRNEPTIIENPTPKSIAEATGGPIREIERQFNEVMSTIARIEKDPSDAGRWYVCGRCGQGDTLGGCVAGGCLGPHGWRWEF